VAITVTARDARGTATNGNSFSSNSVAPTGDSLLLGSVGTRIFSGTIYGAHAAAGFTGFAAIVSALAGDSLSRATILGSILGSSPSADTVDFSWAASPTTLRTTTTVDEVFGVDLSDGLTSAVVQSKGAGGSGTSATVTLDATPASDSLVYAVVVKEDNSDDWSPVDMTALGNTPSGSEQQRQVSAYRIGGSATVTVDFTESRDWEIVVVEFAAESSGANLEAAAALAFALSASGSAQLERVAAVTLPFVVNATVAAERTAVASATLPMTLGASATLRRELDAAAALSWTFGLTGQAAVVRFAAAQLLIELFISSTGERTAVASSSLGMTLGLTTAGQREAITAASLPIVTSLSAQAVRTTFAAATLGQVLSLAANLEILAEDEIAALLEMTMGLTASAVVTRNAAATLQFVTGLDAVAQATRFAAASLELEMALQAAFETTPAIIHTVPFSRLQNRVFRRTTRRR